ncbi:Molybdopterin-guanine dinucleotide biosynthesis protein A [Amycolatopsis marina]|uniref:Molybdopterin-guanine dinucleotide biosynthesis protein A n=1 Tax=Amycolatopsis marina TaxID=490629 RepID=A0A1I1C6V3_9PSEU|nr:molybdenum cofactor guanylyltransferase [Amycolatopsis marina]SFB57872.1 Molybdopterin-guanine dinucleotide biosynthesis protein A [Amycolatopsis marina]
MNSPVEPAAAEGLAAIVLAGGGARRLAGLDKPMIEVGGRTLLHGVLAAVGPADPVIVVGPERAGFPGVRWTREDPPGGGPVAALATGLECVPPGATEVAVLAGDLLGVTASTVRRLRAALGAGDGALLVDEDGRRQWLAGVWRPVALRAALPARPSGAALRRVLGGLSIVEVPALRGETFDVDTPADLDRARRGARADD